MAARTIVPRSVVWSNGISYKTTTAAMNRVTQYQRTCSGSFIHRLLFVRPQYLKST
jgi:hypothetical protein